MPPVRPVVPSLLLLAAAIPAAAQQPDRYTLPLQRAAVYNLVGEMQVQAGTGNEIVVQITRGGADGAQLTIDRGPAGRYESVRVIYPSDEIVYPRMSRRSNSRFRISEDGTFGDGWDRDRRRGRRSGREISVYGSGDGLEAYADITVSVPEGAELAVFVGVGKATVSNVNGRILVDAASASVSAQGVKGSLDVDVGSGPVTVTDAQAELNIDTGSGDVDVTGVQGRDLSIDTGSGEIRATKLVIERASLETGSGHLTLSDVRGTELHLETGSGRIDAQLATDVAILEVETGSGDVVLRVPDNLGAAVDIETGSGDIQTDLPMEVQRWARDHITGRIGDGQGRLDVETGSGDVRIVKLTSVTR